MADLYICRQMGYFRLKMINNCTCQPYKETLHRFWEAYDDSIFKYIYIKDNITSLESFIMKITALII